MNPSATLASLAARLDRLESKDAIRDIVTAYAIACDEQDIARLQAELRYEAPVHPHASAAAPAAAPAA